jgi:hypothetical protein
VAGLVERSKDGSISAEDQSQLEDDCSLSTSRYASRCGDSSQGAPAAEVSIVFFTKAIGIRHIK